MNAKPKRLHPWVVTFGEFRRYPGRAFRACEQGRVIFVRFGAARTRLVMLVPVGDPMSGEAALRQYTRGRCRLASFREPTHASQGSFSQSMLFNRSAKHAALAELRGHDGGILCAKLRDGRFKRHRHRL